MSLQPLHCDELTAARVAPASQPVNTAFPRADTDAAVAFLEAELVTAQRLAALGTMTAMVAHEIRNLVTPIAGRADFALATGQPAQMRKALELAQTQVGRVVGTMQRLLNLAQGVPDDGDSCAVAYAVREALGAATRPFEKDGIDLNVAVAEDLRVRVPPTLLIQVLLNLLLNARAAMKDLRGSLTIGARREGSHVVIDVCDSGRGIPPERIEKVINPFLAASDSSDPLAWRSVGLGLNVCRLIARRHAGTIEASANPDRGCTFRTRWPAAEGN